MSAFRRLIVVLVLIGVPLVGIAFWLAGFWGGLMAVLVVAAGLLRFSGFLGFTTFSPATLQLATVVAMVGIASIALVGVLNYYQQEQKREEDERREKQARVRIVPEPEWREFNLDPVERQKFTVLSGEGYIHTMDANKPFIVVTPSREWPRPAGESGWQGFGRVSLLSMKSLEPGTVVRIRTERVK